MLSGISEDRIVTLQGSEAVRQKMPEKLKKLQQQLWGSAADPQTAKGKGEGFGDCQRNLEKNIAMDGKFYLR